MPILCGADYSPPSSVRELAPSGSSVRTAVNGFADRHLATRSRDLFFMDYKFMQINPVMPIMILYAFH
jgi:hypothetical protein